MVSAGAWNGGTPALTRRRQANLKRYPEPKPPMGPVVEWSLEDVQLRRRVRNALGALAILLAAGCLAGGADEESARPEETVWRLSAEPVLVIGDDADPVTTFEPIAGLVLDSEGRIIVLDGGAAEFRTFSTTGVHLSSWGRRGQGPGEFESPLLLGAFHGDSLLVLDRRSQVASSWSASGGPGWTVRTNPADSPAPRQFLAALNDGSVAFQTVSLFGGVLEEGAVFGDTIRLELLDRHGGESRPLGPAAAPRWIWIENDQVPLPFSPQFSVAVRSDTVFTLGPDGADIRVSDGSGAATSWASPQPPRQVTRKDRDAYRRSLPARGLPEDMERRWAKALDHAEVPSTKPVYDRLVATRDGEVWARRFAAGAGSDTWDVFDPAGRVRGVVATPEGVTVRVVTEDRVLGVRRDSLGVESVVVYAKEAVRDSATVAAALEEIRAELLSLAELQEIYFADNMVYAARLESLMYRPPVRHPDVTVRLLAAGPTGWAAEATHLGLGPAEGCVLFHRQPPEYDAGLVEAAAADEVACTEM